MAASPADASTALAGLHAAGDDIEALSEAIEKAGFLDAVPGDDRQKLRGGSELQGWVPSSLLLCLLLLEWRRNAMQNALLHTPLITGSGCSTTHPHCTPVPKPPPARPLQPRAPSCAVW